MPAVHLAVIGIPRRGGYKENHQVEGFWTCELTEVPGCFFSFIDSLGDLKSS